MIQNKKKCSGCGKDKKIWRRIGRNLYCQPCYYKIQPPKKVKSPTSRTISPRSEKRIIADKKYAKLRKQFLIDNPTCACNGRIPGCTGDDPQYLTIQHKRGRVGSLYLDTRYWCTLALSCHQVINEQPDLALELGLAELRLQK